MLTPCTARPINCEGRTPSPVGQASGMNLRDGSGLTYTLYFTGGMRCDQPCAEMTDLGVRELCASSWCFRLNGGDLMGECGEEACNVMLWHLCTDQISVVGSGGAAWVWPLCVNSVCSATADPWRLGSPHLLHLWHLNVPTRRWRACERSEGGFEVCRCGGL